MMITHIVFFKLKDDSLANLENTKNILLSMEGQIDCLRFLEVGIDFLHSERSYDLALITKFASEQDLNSYQIHPYHVNQVVAYMKKVMLSSATVDFIS